MNMNVGDFSDYIRKLNDQNIFMYKGNNTYQYMQKKF